MSAMPHWLIVLTAAAAIAGILAFLGGAMAFLFVIWPSIRLQTRFIKAQEKGAVDTIIDNL